MSILRSKTWIHIPSDLSVPELMLNNVSHAPDDKIIYEEAVTGKTATYGGFRKDVKRAAFRLKNNFAFQTGHTVAIIGPSCIDYVHAVHSVWWAGGIVSLINYSLHEAEIAYAIDLVQPDFIVVHDSVYDKLSISLSLCKKLLSRVLSFGRSHPEWTSFPVNLPLESPEQEAFSLRNMDASKVVGAILLSGGTTGLPKAVMLSHYNLVAAIYQLRADNPENWRDSQREIFSPPLSHVYALYVVMTGACWIGAYVCLMPRFDLELYCRLMQDRRATLARLVSPIAKLLAENPIVRRYSYPSLEYFCCSAAPLNAETAAKLQVIFPHVALCQTYGCTELSGPCVQSGIRDKRLRTTAAGTIIANTEMKFVEIDGIKWVAKGPGEIVVRGLNIMMGYKDNPRATAETMLENVVFDRLKDIIKYSGFQVSPLEIEEILVRHPLVEEVAVCGIESDDKPTELVRGYIVLKKTNVKPQTNLREVAEEIVEFVGGQVAHYKQLIGGVVFVDALPKNHTGKILRRVLRTNRKEYESGWVHAKL